MSKTLREATLSTRHARSKLSPGVHWRGLNADVHLGYRRAHRTGRWLVRWYLGGQKYRQETIGAADDALQADGQACLSFEQAKSRALAKAADRRTEARATAAGPIQTGVLRALRQAPIERRKGIRLICRDIGPETRKGLSEGLITAALCHPLDPISSLLVQTMIDVKVQEDAGATLQRTVPFEIVTPENI